MGRGAVRGGELLGQRLWCSNALNIMGRKNERGQRRYGRGKGRPRDMGSGGG
jgi:hypothetical protein